MKGSSESGGVDHFARRAFYILVFVLLAAFFVYRNEQERFQKRIIKALASTRPKDIPTPSPVQSQPVIPEPNVSKCAYPIVYNKPHKTGSTMIQMFALRWAQKKGRPAYRCSGFIQTARFQIRECIPHDSSGCAVVATHIELDDITRELLEDRIGKFKTITSTRRPDHRILSSYMQSRHLNLSEANKDKEATLKDIKRFLTGFNPWGTYNYHTGRYVNGSCPISRAEEHLLVKLANRYDIVLDADLTEESNTILASHNLFQISANSTVNSRGSTMLELDDEAKELLQSKICVEEKLHSLFRFRMASAYEKAGGKKCLSEGRRPVSCFKK